MYVCNCHGINERQVKAAINAGATRWKDVHAHYGCKPQCGSCQCEIVEANAEHGAPAQAGGLAAGIAGPALAGAT